MFTVKINTDNAAFEGELVGVEVGRILRQIAHECEQGIVRKERPLFDIYGNTVGQYKLTNYTRK